MLFNRLIITLPDYIHLLLVGYGTAIYGNSSYNVKRSCRFLKSDHQGEHC